MVILSLVQFEKKKEAFWHFVQISTLKLLHLFSKKKIHLLYLLHNDTRFSYHLATVYISTTVL